MSHSFNSVSECTVHENYVIFLSYEKCYLSYWCWTFKYHLSLIATKEDRKIYSVSVLLDWVNAKNSIRKIWMWIETAQECMLLFPFVQFSDMSTNPGLFLSTINHFFSLISHINQKPWGSQCTTQHIAISLLQLLWWEAYFMTKVSWYAGLKLANSKSICGDILLVIVLAQAAANYLGHRENKHFIMLFDIMWRSCQQIKMYFGLLE